MGNAFVTLLSFGTVLGFGAAAVDVGQVRRARTELQAAVDAAAISANLELDGTLEGIQRARARAVEVANRNAASGVAVDISASDVRVGWINTRGVFVEWTGEERDIKNVDTVSLINRPHTVETALGGLAFGTNSWNMALPSGARRPMDGASARTAPCFLPLAVPDCWVANLPPGQNPPPFLFTFSPTPSDNIAWGDPDTSPSTSDVRAQIVDQCSHLPISVTEPMYVNEGLHEAALKEIADILNGVSPVPADVWNTEAYGPLPSRDGLRANTSSRSSVRSTRWGRTLEGVLPLVDAGQDCSNLDFTGSKPITRFAWGVIYDVRTTGTDKNLYVLVDVVTPHVIWGEPDPRIPSNVLARGTAELLETTP